jgi:hypothetical protein
MAGVGSTLGRTECGSRGRRAENEIDLSSDRITRRPPRSRRGFARGLSGLGRPVKPGRRSDRGICRGGTKMNLILTSRVTKGRVVPSRTDRTRCETFNVGETACGGAAGGGRCNGLDLCVGVRRGPRRRQEQSSRLLAPLVNLRRARAQPARPHRVLARAAPATPLWQRPQRVCARGVLPQAWWPR